MALQVLKEAAGHADAAPGRQGLGDLLFAKLVIFRPFLFGVGAVNKSLAHLFHELVDKDALDFGADFGQMAALAVRVFALILQGRD